MSRTRHHGDKEKEKLFGDEWQWYRQEPKAWRRLHKHKPRRASVRRATNKVMRGDEDALFPLDGKPWIYYW